MILDLDLKDIIGPLISAVAAGFSIFFAGRAFRHTRKTADRSLTLEAQKMLFEVDKQLISEPKLWSIYDDHPIVTATQDKSPEFQAKLEAFAYLHLNMFDVVILEALDPAIGAEQRRSRVWLDYFYDTVARSSVTRGILERPDSVQLFNPVLLKLYKQWKKKAQGKAKPS
jgi:hypothetical protein